MKFEILGSGGCRPIPRATCNCRVCKEARVFGEPYKRTGPALYINDAILIDTPEDIGYQLNREKIENIEYIIYSHWHPDHTLGIRVLEQLQNPSWIKTGGQSPVKVCGINEVVNDLMKVQNKYGSYLDYYKSMNLCEVKIIDSLIYKNLKVSLFKTNNRGVASTIFLFEENGKKVIYAPCDIKPFIYLDVFKNADILIMGSFVADGFKCDDFIFNSKIKVYSELYTAKELVKIKEKLSVKRLIVMHIEEEWQLGHDDYKKITENLNNKIEFSYDGMSIELI
ncbi:MAG: MBL fold metallo-hydrolase [Sarcina sp.]